EGLNSPAVRALRAVEPPAQMPFKVTKLGHVVLMVADLERSLRFYTQVLGFKVSDVYPATMVPGGMVFLRFNADHHGVALVGRSKPSGEGAAAGLRDMHHMAFEVATLDEVLRARDHLERHGVVIDFEGRRRAGAQVAVEFRDPDGHRLEIYWGLDQVAWNGPSRPPEEWAEEHSLEDALDHAPPGQDTSLADPGLRRR
ncbi:MAG TPA: VOC family protein, partial [Kiloniellaceae bacterium]|nr:VOC family protein [Kiloniellaceae bacterium]